VENHRGREEGALVYPVYSRRSGGLSVGINLFPDAKVCSFDCPYCEVFPFHGDIHFSVEAMEAALLPVLSRLKAGGAAIKDICFSGNGEPTLSPHFSGAVEAASRIRDSLVPGAALVLITNGTGLLEDSTFHFLRRAAFALALKIWLKLDAGAEDWYGEMARSAVPFHRLTGKIREFTALAPVTIQTMICAVRGRPPPPEEGRAWEKLAVDLVRIGAAGEGGIAGFQLYGKARPAPSDPLSEPLPRSFLESRAASLRSALEDSGLTSLKPVPVDIYP
jgi:histidinol dehydrogenase